MIKCRSRRSLVLGIINLLWFLVRSEYVVFVVVVMHGLSMDGDNSGVGLGLVKVWGFT